MRKRDSLLLVLCLSLLALLSPGDAWGCSEVYLKAAGNVLVSARNFDFFQGDGTIRFSPAGMTRESQYAPEGHEALKWVARYSSISFNTLLPRAQNNRDERIEAGVDGINQRGLKIGTYFLKDSVFPQTGPKTALDICSLQQFLLDSCGTVPEALESLSSGSYRVTATATADFEILLHLFLHDTDGNSAIVEYLDGQLSVIRNPEIMVLTNTPYPASLAALKQFQGFGGEGPIPGGTESLDRFVRGAFFLQNLALPADAAQATSTGFALVQILAVPPRRSPGSTTYWSIVSDLNARRILFRTLRNPAIAWIDLHRLADKGRHSTSLDLLRCDLSGDISTLFLKD